MALDKYDAHINVEICSTILADKYLFKCLTKGSDRAGEAIDTITAATTTATQVTAAATITSATTTTTTTTTDTASMPRIVDESFSLFSRFYTAKTPTEPRALTRICKPFSTGKVKPAP